MNSRSYKTLSAFRLPLLHSAYARQFAMSYDSDARGKIMQKTDIGNYNYDATKIHQLKYLTTISGGANPTVVIGTNERNITYTAFRSVLYRAYSTTPKALLYLIYNEPNAI